MGISEGRLRCWGFVRGGERGGGGGVGVGRVVHEGGGLGWWFVGFGMWDLGCGIGETDIF